MRKTHFVVPFVLVVMLFQTQSFAQEGPSRYVDEYAPIMHFNSVGVNYLPTEFMGKSSEYCAYVNIKPGYIFQYWFYYSKDIRLNADLDTRIKEALQEINQSQKVLDLDPIIREAFHEHDWELVEVHVPQLGGMPTKISFCAHNAHYDLKPNAWPIGATMQGKQCVVKVITDMHGSYPAGLWTPAKSMRPDQNIDYYAKANVEFGIIWAKELAAGYHPELGSPPPYRAINFAGRCRPFSPQMFQVHQKDLPGYPYPMPWDRGFNY